MTSSIHVTKVSEVFQPKTIKLTVAANEASTFLILTFKLPGSEEKQLQVFTGATAGATRDNIKSRIDSTADIAALFSTANDGATALDITQKVSNGNFTVAITTPSGTLSVTQSVVQAAEFTPRRYKLNVSGVFHDPVAGDKVLSTSSLSGKSGLYNVLSVNTTELSVTVSDVNNLLNPTSDRAVSTEDFLLIKQAQFLDFNSLPSSFVQAALGVTLSTVTSVADADYTVTTTDKVLVLADPAANRTLTFASGADGQRVLVILPTVTANAWQLVGLEVDPGDLDAAGDNIECVYLSGVDQWRVILDNIAP